MRIFGLFLSQLLPSKKISYLSCKKLYSKSEQLTVSLSIMLDDFSIQTISRKEIKFINIGIFLSKVFKEIPMLNRLLVVESF